MRLSHLSIKQRMTLILVMIALISVGITTVILTAIGVYNLRKNIQDELVTSAELVGDSTRAAIMFEDVEFATRKLEVYQTQRPITKVCLFDGSGKLFSQFVRDENAKQRCPKTARLLQSHDDFFSITHPIADDQGEAVGSIFIESDEREVEAYLRRQTVMTIGVVAAMGIIAYILARLLQRTITRPILRLAEVAGEITDSSDFSLRAEVPGDQGSRTEIDLLYRAFNRMLNEINEREALLMAKNEELTAARDAAEHANQSKSQFLANVSHELRTPLNAIIGFSSIIMNELFGKLSSPKYLEYAKDINDSGVHLLDVINDILDLSKAEAGKLNLTFEEVNIRKAIQKCVTLLSEKAHEEQVFITTHIPDNVPYLIADRLRFVQIMLNILSNAVKFTKEGGRISITVKTEESGGDVTDFFVIVEDTGIGMTANEITKAFQSFGQIDSGLNRKYEGTGLGLPLTRKLMELHHGSITIDSTPKVGTKVTLHFVANPIYIDVLSSRLSA